MCAPPFFAIVAQRGGLINLVLKKITAQMICTSNSQIVLGLHADSGF